MTNSPPANVRSLVKGETARVLACGFDTLYLAVNLRWNGTAFFDYLRSLKTKAVECEEDQPGQNLTAAGEDWQFVVRPYGMKGYEWLLDSREFRLDLGGWTEPKQRPSAMAYIGSETLWMNGPDESIKRILRHLEAAGAAVQIVKSSRADLTLDILLRAEDWHRGLVEQFVTRADDIAMYQCRRKLTGFKIGSGDIVARLYDKPAEIARKKQKQWMFDVWGLPAVPEDHVVIRVEFQLRREALREMGADTFALLRENQGAIWAYCSQDWLKVQDHPERHSSRRHTLAWWEVVQAGFTGAQGATPAVRRKAILYDELQLSQQMFGLLTSIMALQDQTRTMSSAGMLTIVAQLPKILQSAQRLGLSDEAVTESVMKKISKYRRKQPNNA